ncbi:MAG: putative ABC transporter permease [Oscillospiraceae bacterium]|nr:putative ABC transporter permease [Oscillospiraceae bacterium]
MNICRYFLCFAVFSFIGWAYETVYYTIQQRRFVNSGFLSTCFCPIYGIGALLDLILLGWIENSFLLFLAGMFVTGSLEYFVSYLLERLFHKRWWDYTGWPLNINGRVCIFGVTAFGLFTVALIKVIFPFTMEIINNMGILSVYIMSAAVAFVMIADTIKTIKDMDTSKLWYVEKQSEIFSNIKTGEESGVVRRIKDALKR